MAKANDTAEQAAKNRRTLKEMLKEAVPDATPTPDAKQAEMKLPEKLPGAKAMSDEEAKKLGIPTSKTKFVETTKPASAKPEPSPTPSGKKTMPKTDKDKNCKTVIEKTKFGTSKRQECE